MADAHGMDEQVPITGTYTLPEQTMPLIPHTYTLCIYNIYTVDDTAKPRTQTCLD